MKSYIYQFEIANLHRRQLIFSCLDIIGEINTTLELRDLLVETAVKDAKRNGFDIKPDEVLFHFITPIQ